MERGDGGERRGGTIFFLAPGTNFFCFGFAVLNGLHVCYLLLRLISNLEFSRGVNMHCSYASQQNFTKSFSVQYLNTLKWISWPLTESHVMAWTT